MSFDDNPIDDLVESHEMDQAIPEPVDLDDAAQLIGEFDEETEEDISFSTHAAECKPLPVSDKLKAAMNSRISAMIKLEKLDRKRTQMMASPDIADNVKMSLSMQTAEFRALPELKQAQEKYENFEHKVASLRAKIAAQQDNDEIPDDQKLAPPSKAMEASWGIAREQYALLIERGEFLPAVINEAKEYLSDEPLYRLLQSFKFPAEKVFCLAIYQLALESWNAYFLEQKKEKQKEVVDFDSSHKTFFGKVKKDALAEKETLENELEIINTNMTCLGREISSLQKQMVSEFWKLYEFCACLLISKKIPPKKVPLVRALIRYGLMGHAPWFISPAITKHLLSDCIVDVVDEYNPSMDASHVVYADEYLQFVVSGDFTPSIDENLELTGRNTPEWSADKALRRLAYSKTRAYVLKEMRTILVHRTSKLRTKQEELTITKSKLLKTAKDYKKRNAELAQEIQHTKVEAARYERIINRIDTKDYPDVTERAAMAKERIVNSGVKISSFQLTRKEVAGVHRVCRLCARLKDPFLPFVLRDNYKIDQGIANSRAEIQKQFEYIESCDRNVFNEVLVNSLKEAQRLYLRFHPVTIITPSCGFIGYSWNPRVGVESGKLVIPGYCPRSGIQERMLFNMFADFRWDTSKAAAGVDLLTSDTLVAAYSTVRWDYRKKKRENREKALIFNEVNDRQNWRRHYELYLQSAHDSGRKLYYKNYEVYEMITKYVGLPLGKERLRR